MFESIKRSYINRIRYFRYFVIRWLLVELKATQEIPEAGGSIVKCRNPLIECWTNPSYLDFGHFVCVFVHLCFVFVYWCICIFVFVFVYLSWTNHFCTLLLICIIRWHSDQANSEVEETLQNLVWSLWRVSMDPVETGQDFENIFIFKFFSHTWTHPVREYSDRQWQ